MHDVKKPHFQIYGPQIFTLLSSFKILDNSNITSTRKLLDTCVTLFLLSLSGLLIISEALDFQSIHDLESFAARVNPICFHLLGSYKWIYSIFSFNDIDDLIRRIKRCHELSLNINNGDKEYNRLKRKIMVYKQQMSRYSGLWLIICVSGILQWCMNPLIYHFYNKIIDKHLNATLRQLPYLGRYPWNVDTNWKYIGTFTFQLISGLATTFGHALFEISSLQLLASGCLHLEYLNECLTDVRNNALIFTNGEAIEKFEINLRNSMKHHVEVLECLRKFIKVFSAPLFVICVDSTLVLCLISLEASSIKFDSSIECIMRVISLMEYWTGVNLTLFIYCYMASKTEKLGLQIADSIYSCDWERTLTCSRNSHRADDRRVIKIIQTIRIGVMRAQKPIVITGGLFYVLSLPTFKAVVGFALSNAVVLRQLSEDE